MSGARATGGRAGCAVIAGASILRDGCHRNGSATTTSAITAAVATRGRKLRRAAGMGGAADEGTCFAGGGTAPVEADAPGFTASASVVVLGRASGAGRGTGADFAAAGSTVSRAGGGGRVSGAVCCVAAEADSCVGRWDGEPVGCEAVVFAGGGVGACFAAGAGFAGVACVEAAAGGLSFPARGVFGSAGTVAAGRGVFAAGAAVVGAALFSAGGSAGAAGCAGAVAVCGGAAVAGGLAGLGRGASGLAADGGTLAAAGSGAVGGRATGAGSAPGASPRAWAATRPRASCKGTW